MTYEMHENRQITVHEMDMRSKAQLVLARLNLKRIRSMQFANATRDGRCLQLELPRQRASDLVTLAIQ